MLYEIYDKTNSKKKNIIYKELKRLDPDLSIKHKPVVSVKKEFLKPELVTLSNQAYDFSRENAGKENLRLIISYSKNKSEQNKAQNILDNL